MKCQTGWSTVGIKIAGRNTNNLRYADDTTLMAESEEELKRLLMKVREESEKADLKLNIQKMKIMVFSSMTSWQIDGQTVEAVRDFIFLGSKITADGDCSHEIKRCMLLGRKAMTNLVKSLSRVRLFATTWTVACQAPPSMGLSRQECWSGLPFPSPGDLPNPGIKTGSPTLQADSLTFEPPGKPWQTQIAY